VLLTRVKFFPYFLFFPVFALVLFVRKSWSGTLLIAFALTPSFSVRGVLFVAGLLKRTLVDRQLKPPLQPDFSGFSLSLTAACVD